MRMRKRIAKQQKIERKMGGSTSSSEQHEMIKRTNDRYFGLENFSNTCYINSVLQALYFSKRFRKELIRMYQQFQVQRDNYNYKKDEKSLFMALGRTYWEISRKKKQFGTYSPKDLVAQIKKENEVFNNYRQHDAQEFLLFLFNNLKSFVHDQHKKRKKIQQTSADKNQEKKQDNKNKKDFIDEIFGGEFSTETRCITCEEKKYRKEKFLILPVGVDQNVSLTQCLKNFSNREILKGSNKFFCENCHSYQEAYKSMKMDSLPNVLVLQLKRFKFIESLGRFKKLDYRVATPFELKLTNLTDRMTESDEDFNVQYNLQAVVDHRGLSQSCGHYYTFVRCLMNESVSSKTKSEKWVIFNDESVSLTDRDRVRETYGCKGAYDTSYLLFYQKREA